MKKIQFLKVFFFTITLTVISWSCERTANEILEPQILVSSNLVNQLTKEQLIASVNATGVSQTAILISSGVKQYKIVYKTKNADGSEILASGALIVPTDIKAPLGLLSYQHGTIFNDQQAPSYFAAGGESSLVSLVASSGYLAIASDYIGYGSSNNVPHNYEHRATLASASLDMIRATKQFIDKEKLNWNKNLYIAGYSEGGFATLALQKLIEEETSTEFNLKASSCGAGAYNKSLSFKTLASTPSSGNPQHNASYIWVLLTYDRIYELNRPFTEYFAPKFADQIQREKQDARISGSLTTILSDGLKIGVIEGTDVKLLNAVKDNDIFDWKPKTPTQLYHGTSDSYVPFFNSQTAIDAMQKRGASNVELIPVAGGEHNTSIQPFFFGTILFFESKK